MSVSKNLVDEIWKEGRPSLSNATIFPLGMKFTGELHVEDFGMHCRFHCKRLSNLSVKTLAFNENLLIEYQKRPYYK